MGVNQKLIPEVVRDLLAEKQTQGYEGEISIHFVAGEVHSIYVAEKRMDSTGSNCLCGGPNRDRPARPRKANPHP